MMRVCSYTIPNPYQPISGIDCPVNGRKSNIIETVKIDQRGTEEKHNLCDKELYAVIHDMQLSELFYY